MTSTLQGAPFNGEVHPAAALFPLIEGEEMDRLVESIRSQGLQHPIVLTMGGVLLDGRNRLKACQTAGVRPRFETYTGTDYVDYVVRVNIDRRHLTVGQRAALGHDLLPLKEKEARARMAAGGRKAAPGQKGVADSPPLSKQLARDEAAKQVGSSGRRVGQFKRVAEQAPDLAEKVRSGDLALDTAEKQAARRQHEKDEQQARKVKLSNVTPDAEGSSWRLLHGDFRERLGELGDGTVDLIITDPPYPEESLPLYGELSHHAARVLKPQGLLVVLTGQIYLPRVMALLGQDRNLAYGWCYCQPLPGANSRIMGRHIAQTWKPWLVYSNGAWPSGFIDWHEDTVDPSKRSKTYRWEQGAEPADYLIANLSLEHAIILDPFTGTGTYGEAALRQGRTFIGVENDADRFTKASERLAAL